MALSNELPERSLFKDNQGNWRAARAWLVTGAVSESDALRALAMDNSPIPQIGNSHDQNKNLLCDSVSPQQSEPLTYRVVATYSIPPELNGGDASKLKLPPVVSIRRGSISVAVDRTRLGNGITNSAGDALNPPLQRTLKVRYLRIARWEPYYDVAKADAFEDTVNVNDITIAGAVFVAAQRAYCDTIELDGEYPGNNTVAVRVVYNFILRRDPNDELHPFNFYPKDQGRRGYYSKSGTPTLGEFYNADGTQVSDDVPLNGKGVPIDTTIKVGSDLNAPIANPNLPANFPIATAISNSKVTYLEFNVVGLSDFLLLNL